MIIDNLIEKYGKNKVEDMLNYLDLILERNNYINLTAVRDRDEAISKHLVDSLTITDLEEYIDAKKIIDIGTGAGFPGIPLAIVNPEKEIVLLDSTLKRIKVIDEFAEEIGIQNTVTVHARAEEVAKKEGFGESFDLCVSRAVANLNKLSEWCLPFVSKGGSFVAYKGENYQEEIKEAENTIRKLGGKVDRIVSLPEDDDSISGHVLIVIRKIK